MSKSVKNIRDEFPRLAPGVLDDLDYELQACRYLASRLIEESPVKGQVELRNFMLVASNLLLASRLSNITDELTEIKHTQL